ncbi:hypothetical protein L1049_008166 [Liquidambar formosana]|uniref:Uncharacterized protein n=1 Tax=Liquidambar formosana TaxID=63359 RepID=A0AAP0X839_LIQFO
MEASEKILEVVEQASLGAEILETKLKVIEVAVKVLEAIGYGTVILPTAKRLHMACTLRLSSPYEDAVTGGRDRP